MVEVGVGEQLLLLPHGFVDGFGHREQHGIAHFFSQLFRPTLNHLVTRVAVFVDRVAKAHDLVFARQHAESALDRVFSRGKALDHFHGRFVGATVQRAAQRADGRSDARIQIGQRRCTDTGGEG